MAERKSIPKSLRFEVFKRDSFTCQYCGRKAPDVLLHVDHIKPVSKDGTNDLLNLITSCEDCNSGKSDRELSDNTVIQKQRDQLEALQERKEQIEMMFEWQKSLLELDDKIVEQLSDYWSELAVGYSLSETGRASLKKLSRKYKLDEIMVSMKISSEQYLEMKDGKYTQESVENAWNKVSGICYNRRLEKENPNLSRLYYIRGIMRKRFNYVNEHIAIELLTRAYDLGASVESLEQHSKTSRNWSIWKNGIEDFIDSQSTEDTTNVQEGEDG